MSQKIEINDIHCLCSDYISGGKIAYILYPMEGFLDHWIDSAARKYGTTIAVITGMDWQNVFSPWPAKGVPAGSQDFKGESLEFLNILHQTVIPKMESALGYITCPERTLVGVSMSGLFALWQWILCDTFTDIASLSGSFWYEGFMDWIKSHPVSHKRGRAFFLLGNLEARSSIKAFQTVGVNTEEIIALLKKEGVRVRFQSVPGNHYSNPIPRLDAAFSALSQE
ncbi:MAG: alpha/beta hydrolase-fold protein [Odoribacter sp.]|nr:alpha/beta hydrolase-fold protein [Odoribacter sp.]